MPWIQRRAASIWAGSDDAILIMPSSSMSTLAPVFATISRMTLPPVPMTSRILSLGIGHRLDARRVGRKLLAGVVERLGHLAEDVRAAVLRLGERDLHDLLGDAGDLDVHLQRGDAVGGAGDLEVHVAEVIFVTEDVADHGEILAFEDQAHRDAGDRRFSGTPASISARLPPQTVAIDEEPLLSVMSERTRIVYGNSSIARQHRVQRAPGELAVADFATRRERRSGRLRRPNKAGSYSGA